MTTEEVFEEYGDEPLFFTHYYNFIFVDKSTRLDNGDQIFLHLGGNMEKVSAMVVDVEDTLTLNEKADDYWRQFGHCRGDGEVICRGWRPHVSRG